MSQGTLCSWAVFHLFRSFLYGREHGRNGVKQIGGYKEGNRVFYYIILLLFSFRLLTSFLDFSFVFSAPVNSPFE